MLHVEIVVEAVQPTQRFGNLLRSVHSLYCHWFPPVKKLQQTHSIQSAQHQMKVKS